MRLVTRRRRGLVLAALVAAVLVAAVVVDRTGSPPPEQTAGVVLWEGGFDTGSVPPGANGPDCGTGGRDDRPANSTNAYGSVEEEGNSACTNTVELTSARTRSEDSARSLKVVIGPRQQREQLQSTFTWSPDPSGSVDHWYGFSFYYGDDWNLGGGLQQEVSASSWHNPVAWRVDGPNGSLNISGDLNLDNANGEPFETFSTPHLVLRRNTVLDEDGFYTDGRGLDKLDLGPVVIGEWMDVVCHVRWSTTSRNALRECWRDGEYVGARSSRNAVSSDPHTLRVGQYQTAGIDHERTTFVDNVRIGTSYSAVDPARDRSAS